MGHRVLRVSLEKRQAACGRRRILFTLLMTAGIAAPGGIDGLVRLGIGPWTGEAGQAWAGRKNSDDDLQRMQQDALRQQREREREQKEREREQREREREARERERELARQQREREAEARRQAQEQRAREKELERERQAREQALKQQERERQQALAREREQRAAAERAAAERAKASAGSTKSTQSTTKPATQSAKSTTSTSTQSKQSKQSEQTKSKAAEQKEEKSKAAEQKETKAKDKARDEKEQEARRKPEPEPEPIEPPRTAVEAVQRIWKSISGPPAAPPPKLELPKGAITSKAVLVVNPDATTLRRAEEMGFSVDKSARTPGGSSTRRLVAPPGMSVSAVEQALSGILRPDQVALNQIYRPIVTQSAEKEQDGKVVGDGYCEERVCYGPAAIRWRRSLGSCAERLPIGVIDTAADLDHPALIRIAHSKKFGSRPETKDLSPHGTGILGLLAGNPKRGIPGLIPTADFYHADVFFPDDRGEPISDTASLLGALEWMREQDVRVINMSISGPPDPVLHEMIQVMVREGRVFIAAAGNGGPSAPPTYPAAYPEVVAVTAVDNNRKSYRHANRGDFIDVAAPGVGIWTAAPEGKAGFRSGTSFAVPYVTAVIAAMYGHSVDKSKSALLAQLPLRDLGTPGRDPVYGRGFLQAPASCIPEAGLVTSSFGNPWAADVIRTSAPATVGPITPAQAPAAGLGLVDSTGR